MAVSPRLILKCLLVALVSASCAPTGQFLDLPILTSSQREQSGELSPVCPFLANPATTTLFSLFTPDSTPTLPKSRCPLRKRPRYARRSRCSIHNRRSSDQRESRAMTAAAAAARSTPPAAATGWPAVAAARCVLVSAPRQKSTQTSAHTLLARSLAPPNTPVFLPERGPAPPSCRPGLLNPDRPSASIPASTLLPARTPRSAYVPPLLSAPAPAGLYSAGRNSRLSWGRSCRTGA